MTTGFVDERLDVDIEQGAQGGPMFMTTVIELSNSYEQRNQEWTYPRQEWDISYGIQSPSDFAQVVAMFYNTAGRFAGFRFQDWSDYTIGNPFAPTSATAQSIGTGNALNNLFQIFKRYPSPGNTTFFDRAITRPQHNSPSTLTVYVNGVLQVEGTAYICNYDTGLITFQSGYTPGNGLVVSINTFFDVPVRFDSDSFKQKMTWTGATELPSIRIIELKEYAGVV